MQDSVEGDPLSYQQRMALMWELTSTKNLMRDGLGALSQLLSDAEGLSRVLALTSIGVERLMKVSIGIYFLDRNGAWPDMKTRSHGIGAMDGELLAILHRTATSHYLVGLLDQVEHDRHRLQLMEILHNYGMGGRFYYLDYLARDSEGKYRNPEVQWDELRLGIANESPGLLDCFASEDESVRTQALRTVNATMGESIRQWWEMIYRFWQHGALGERARRICGDLSPEG